jgi:hypothetical protein
MEVTPSGIVMEVREEQPEKHSEGKLDNDVKYSSSENDLIARSLKVPNCSNVTTAASKLVI